MTKEISFIVEFDELNDEQLKDLINYLDDNSIKRRTLRSNYHFLKEEDYKQALIEIKKCCEDNAIEVNTREWGNLVVTNIDDILKIIDKYLEKSDKK